MPFLKLSRELRDEVYEYVTDLTTHSFVDYSGFYLSCQQIKNELDNEGAKHVKACLMYLKSAAGMHNTPESCSDPRREFLFDISGTFKDLQNPCLSLGLTKCKR